MKRYQKQLGEDYPMHPFLGIILCVLVWMFLLGYALITAIVFVDRITSVGR